MKTEIYWVEEKLAILMRPRGGDWLQDEVRDWSNQGLQVIVSLLTSYEVAELGLADESVACQSAGLEFFCLPIEDRSVPDHLLDTVKLVDTLYALYSEGKKMGIHCRQGLGRSPLIAGCLLVRAGMAPEMAFAKIGAARGTIVPETAEQREWLKRFAEELRTLTAQE